MWPVKSKTQKKEKRMQEFTEIEDMTMPLHEYIVEVYTKEGPQFSIPFETQFVEGVFEDFSEIALKDFFKKLNTDKFVLLGSTVIRQEDIKYCRIEPKVIERTFKRRVRKTREIDA